MSTPSFLEEYISQIPAVELLLKSGYRYLSRDEHNQQRAGKTSHAVLLNILTESQQSILPLTIPHSSRCGKKEVCA